MKLLQVIGFGQLFVLATVFLFTGCLSEPVKTEWALDHPANPRAPQTPFTRPPNPFKYDGSMVEFESGDSSHSLQESSDKDHQQRMNHQMNQMNKSKLSKESTPEKTIPDHKEHHQ